jgi:hypothetical protein
VNLKEYFRITQSAGNKHRLRVGIRSAIALPEEEEEEEEKPDPQVRIKAAKGEGAKSVACAVPESPFIEPHKPNDCWAIISMRGGTLTAM